ncbi:MAG: hypothetical protein WDM80_08680 [Limisphaerales bacterium]
MMPSTEAILRGPESGAGTLDKTVAPAAAPVEEIVGLAFCAAAQTPQSINVTSEEIQGVMFKSGRFNFI